MTRVLLLCLALPARRPGPLEAALKHLESQVEAAMREVGTSGLAVAVAQGDRVVYRKGFAVRRLGEREPVTPETVFQIGSGSGRPAALRPAWSCAAHPRRRGPPAASTW